MKIRYTITGIVDTDLNFYPAGATREEIIQIEEDNIKNDPGLFVDVLFVAPKLDFTVELIDT